MKEQLFQFVAAGGKIPAGGEGGVGVPQVSAGNAINGVLTAAYFAAGITAVIVIIICGILYATSQGDASKTQRAKDGILYAVVGLVFVMMAFVITNFIVGRF